MTGYVVTPYLAGVAQTVRTFASTATTQTVTGLVNAKIYTFRVAATTGLGTGKSYTFTVAARNSRGSGPASAKSNTVKPT